MSDKPPKMDDKPVRFPAPPQQPEPKHVDHPPDYHPMRFFQTPAASQPDPEPETPEIRQQRDEQERVSFLLNEADRLHEMNVLEPARTNALSAIHQRYKQWRHE